MFAAPTKIYPVTNSSPFLNHDEPNHSTSPNNTAGEAPDTIMFSSHCFSRKITDGQVVASAKSHGVGHRGRSHHHHKKNTENSTGPGTQGTGGGARAGDAMETASNQGSDRSETSFVRVKVCARRMAEFFF